MKKLQSIVFTMIFLFSSAILANDIFPIGGQEAVQSYQSAQLVTSDKSAARSAATLPAVNSSSQTANVALSRQTFQQLESELNQLSQQSLLYNQQVNQRIESLNGQGVSIQARLQQVIQAMILLNQQLSTIRLAQQKQLLTAQLNNTPSTPKHKYSVSKITQYIAFIMTMLLAIMVGILLTRQQRGPRNTVKQKKGFNNAAHSSATTNEKEEVSPNQNNPLVSSMNMEDSVVLRRALEDIVRDGDSQQCEMAKSILKVLQEKKKAS